MSKANGQKSNFKRPYDFPNQEEITTLSEKMRLIGRILTKGYSYVESRCMLDFQKNFVASLKDKESKELLDIVKQLDTERMKLAPGQD